MTTTIEHVRHRAWYFEDGDQRIAVTNCGRRFVWTTRPTRDTRHHQPATSRCPECYR